MSLVDPPSSDEAAWEAPEENIFESNVKAANQLNDFHRSILSHGDSPEPKAKADYGQWVIGPNSSFRPTGMTILTLNPAVYKVRADNNGIFLQVLDVVTDDLVVLPGSVADKMLPKMHKFWASKDRYAARGLLYKKGAILYGPPGCHAAGTEVVMLNGSLKKVEDVQIGDILLGPDGDGRRVLDLCRGCDDMYRIHPKKGEPFDINGHHILSLTRSRKRDGRFPTVLNTSLNEFIGLSKCSQESFKLRHSIPMEFTSESRQNLSIDPYLLGVWLGDGNTADTSITTADPEIKELCYAVADEYDLHVTSHRKTSSICRTYHIAGDKGPGGNPLLDKFNALNLIDNKHIPEHYMTSSIGERMELLAGLIDTDGGNEGSWSKISKYGKSEKLCHYFSITQKRKELSYQIVRLARSLGFGVTIKQITKTLKARNFIGTYYRVHIFGDTDRIPCRIERKKAKKGTPNKDHLRTGIESIEPLGIGQYYGFTLSGDHLYLTSDFIVHHNSGKSCDLMLLMKQLITLGGIVVVCEEPALTTAGLQIIRKIEPDRNIIVVYEDIDEMIERRGDHDLLSLLDGEDQISNVLNVATTNYIDRLEARIANRPGRFDLRFFVDMPNTDARRVYLQKTSPEMDEVTIEKWIKDTHGFSIAHLRELTSSVMCMDEDYEEALSRLKDMRIKPKDNKTGFDKGEGVGFSLGK